MSVKIMATIWELDLSQDLKLIALAFADYANDEGICWPSVGRVAWKSGYSVRSVQRKLVLLMEVGIFEMVAEANRGPGHPTVYKIRPELGKPLQPYIPEKEDENATGDNLAPLEATGDNRGATGDNRGARGDRAMSPKPLVEPLVEPSVLGANDDGDRLPVGNRDLFGSDEALLKVTKEIGSFCLALDTRWTIKAPILSWATEIGREPRYAGVDLPYEIRRAREWYEGKGKKPKAPHQAIRNWLEKASERTAKEVVAAGGKGPDWLKDLSGDFGFSP